MLVPVPDALRWTGSFASMESRSGHSVELPGIGDALRISVGPWNMLEASLSRLRKSRGERHERQKVITIFDYGAGNIHSLGKALDAARMTIGLESDPLRALDTDALVLPGVGAFTNAAGGWRPVRSECATPSCRVSRHSASASECSFFSSRARKVTRRGLGVLRELFGGCARGSVPQIGWN